MRSIDLKTKAVAGRRAVPAILIVVAVLTSGAFAQDPVNGEVAKIAAIQNQVETQSANAGTWVDSTLNQALFEKDRVRTGADSRAAILYSDQTLHRLNAKSEIEVLAPTTGPRSGVLKVISGEHYFSSRRPKDYGQVETPTVTAAIKGTEFLVEVAEDGTTTITMFEGVVEASNEQGSVSIGSGEQAYVEPGKAPVSRIAVRPRDAVAWTLYYPPVLGHADTKHLESLGADGEELAAAAAALSAGQVAEAQARIEPVRQRHPDDPVALALVSVIEVVNDNKDEALKLANRAVQADAQSAAAALALSIAEQASFNIPRARELAEKAAVLDPDSALALARAAELRMAEGDISGARRAAERAVERDPDQPLARTVLGFVELALYKTKEAESTFDQAIAAEPSLSMARLGKGLAMIQRGDLEAGREELQTAVILDPGDSLLRSYLGKAYYEERRASEATTELSMAKELDPLDPTPHLYGAILNQTDNRPVEALRDLQSSIDLNDNRAVYRSRLLLDEDRAVRGADLARVYNDLGFEQLGLVAARRSADVDQSNYSAHLTMAGNYRSLPDFGPAFLSELLQGRIYQPVNSNAARPDLINEGVSFNEYSALFDRQRLRGFGEFSYGDTNTDLSGLIPPDAMCPDGMGGTEPCIDQVSLDGSNPRGGEVIGTMYQDRWALALGYDSFKDEGFRVNTDSKIDNYRGFLSYSPTYRDTIQLNYLRGDGENGDLPLREFPAVVTPQRFDSELTNVNLAYHRAVKPGQDLAISAIYNETIQTGTSLTGGGSSTATLDGPQLEAQYVLRSSNSLSWIFGAGGFDGDQKLESSSTGTTLTGADTFNNGYVYARLNNLGPVELTVGGSYEDVEAPLGLLTPRDAGIIPAELQYSNSQFSPKLGVSWYIGNKTTLRAAAYARLSPAIGRIQTLEPTQVSGFNQLFRDTGGTESVSYGIGWDQKFTSFLFGGISLISRDLTVPEAFCDIDTSVPPGSFQGCAGEQASQIVDRNADSYFAQAYLNATVGKRTSISLEYYDNERDFNTTQVNSIGFFEDYVRTRAFTPEVRGFLPFGLFTAIRATNFQQQIDSFDDLASPARVRSDEEFWIADFEIGYRFPKRYGSLSLQALNFTNEQFPVFLAPQEQVVIPSRQIRLSLIIQN